MQIIMAHQAFYKPQGIFSDENEWKRSDKFKLIDTYIRVQYENSMQLGYKPSDLILATNFIYSYKDLRVFQFEDFSKYSLFICKYHAVNKLYDEGVLKDKVWFHDLDCFQLIPFDFPEEVKEIGICKYAFMDYFNAGSIFITRLGRKAFREYFEYFDKVKKGWDEQVLKDFMHEHPERSGSFIPLNNRYNLNNLDDPPFYKKYDAAIKPIVAAHFHPDDIGNWRTFCEGYMNRGRVIVNERVRALMIREGFRRYSNPGIFYVLPGRSVNIVIDSPYFPKDFEGRFGFAFRAYVTEENGKEVFKFWYSWDRSDAKRLYDLIGKSNRARLILTRCKRSLELKIEKQDPAN